MPERKLFPGSAQVIDLARARAVRAQIRRPRRTARTPRYILAAGLAVGLLVGISITRLFTGNELTLASNGRLFAHGALDRALNEQLAGHGAESANTPIRVTATYRTRDGNTCRSFSVAGSAPLTGLACRASSHWQIQGLLTSASASAEQELTKYMNAPALTPAAESQLRGHDWQ